MNNANTQVFCRFFASLVAMAGLLASVGRASAVEPTSAVAPVACVGDSITEACGYPAELQKLLGSGYEVINCGRSGTTAQHQGDAPYWNTEQFARAKGCNPKIVTIMLGTNDTKAWNWHRPEDCTKDIAEMVEIFRQLPSKPLVVLCLPPPAYQDGYNIRGAVIKDELVPALRALAKAKAIPLLDINAALSNHAECFGDGIHPNMKGSELIAKTMGEGLAAILKEQAKAEQAMAKTNKKTKKTKKP
jgi:acyl-CoA thioesterase I